MRLRRLATPARPRLRTLLGMEVFEERITPYSASGNKWEQPSLVTISFVPDGTSINGYASNLQSTFNTKFGSAATWQNVFLKAAQVWAEQTNINFKVVTDSGVASGSGNYRQGDTTFGDIRIGGYNFGNSTLAQAYMPPLVNNYSIAGDIVFNTGQTFNVGSSYDLFTVAAHEFGHALGLNHGAVGSVMSSAYPGTLTTLATDDINGIRNVYSANAARALDSYDAAASNGTTATASVVTSVINTTTKAGVINSLDLSTSADVDVYKFVVPTGSSTTLKARVVSLGLSLMNPKVEILDSAGVVKATTTAGATVYGADITATFAGIAAGATYYVRVSSTNSIASFKTGKYSLVLNMGTGADPAITYPSTQVANGSPKTAGGGVAVTDGIETLVNTGSTSFAAGSKTTTTLTRLDGFAAPTTIASGQPAIAMDASGNYVVVWESSGHDGSGAGIYAQRYSAAGLAQGAEFRVNTTTVGDQTSPAVAMRSDGEFVVVWVSNGQDGGGQGIYAQRYSNAGAALGGEFRVNTTTAGDQITPAVAYSLNLSFVIAWSSYGQDTASKDSWGIYAQRYLATGLPLLGEFKVNTTTAGDQINPVIGLDQNGNCGIGWSSYNQDGTNSWGSYYQAFVVNGILPFILPYGEKRLNITTAGDQKLAAAAMAPNGSWMAVWTSSGQDGSGLGVYAIRFDAMGNPVGSEFRVNTTTTGDQTNPSATTDSSGNYYITWQSYNQFSATSGWDLYGQQYSTSGSMIDGEFKVNSTTAGDQVNPAIAMDNNGHLVVVWNGAGIGGVTDGVFMQRYSVNTAFEVPGASDSWDPEGEDHDHGNEFETVRVVSLSPFAAPEAAERTFERAVEVAPVNLAPAFEPVRIAAEPRVESAIAFLPPARGRAADAWDAFDPMLADRP